MEDRKVGMDIADICVIVGFAKTKGEARRLIKQGGIKVNDLAVPDPFARVVKDKDKWYIVW